MDLQESIKELKCYRIFLHANISSVFVAVTGKPNAYGVKVIYGRIYSNMEIGLTC
jgi:hypothetical protein